ncbi:MAG: c-type cytochrome [Chitinophagaceae bacterium]|nr:c-type cytochrome [Chitinophagaceae bacterium]
MKYLKIFLFFMLLVPVLPAFARVKTVSSASEPAAIVLLSVIAILAVAILFMVRAVLSVYSIQKPHKKKNTAKALTVLLIAALMIPGAVFAQEAEAAAQSVRWIGGLDNTTSFLLISVIVLELIVIFYYYTLFRALTKDSKKAFATDSVRKKFSWFEKLNRTKTVDAASEEQFNMGHDYDGIQELDNPTPPWWNWGFIISGIFAVVYLWVYFVSHSAPNQYKELEIANTKAEAKIKAYMASSANNVDENTVTLLTDAADLNEGQKLFVANCAACHLTDGGGIVGPNLTDDYWIHGGSIQDIFKTIKYGVPDKGMISWKETFTPRQIQQIASFVHSLKGTKPANPKEPEGELYKEGATDSEAPAEVEPGTAMK